MTTMMDLPMWVRKNVAVAGGTVDVSFHRHETDRDGREIGTLVIDNGAHGIAWKCVSFFDYSPAPAIARRMRAVDRSVAGAITLDAALAEMDSAALAMLNDATAFAQDEEQFPGQAAALSEITGCLDLDELSFATEQEGVYP